MPLLGLPTCHIPWSQIDWGDAPTWVSAVVTALALVAALRIVNIERGRDERRREADNELREEKRQAFQADHIGAWSEYERAGARAGEGLVGGRMRWVAVVVNDSKLPVYAAEVDFVVGDQRYTDGAGQQIPPGRNVFEWPADLERDHGPSTVRENNERNKVQIELLFRDTANVMWQRGRLGQLKFIPNRPETLPTAAEQEKKLRRPRRGRRSR